MMNKQQKVLFFGLLASIFFSFTFILNRSMSLTGGSFLWSASLRYIFSFPFLLIYVVYKKRTEKIHSIISKDMLKWFIWSNIGFSLFYLPLTFASNYGTSWLVAATWQFTIVAGTLLSPLFNQKIHKKSLFCAILILIGVFVLQFDNITNFKLSDIIYCLIPMIIAAINYPLGNRKIMHICPKEINTLERIYAMTLCSLPFWIICSIIAYTQYNLPDSNQILQSFMVSIFSALIATILFFYSTDLAKGDSKLLSLAESTIAGEVIFTLIGGIIFLNDPPPNIIGWIGIIIIVIGMLLISNQNKNK